MIKKYKHSRKEIVKNLTIFSLEKTSQMLLEPAEWPKEGDDFWYIECYGEIENDNKFVKNVDMELKDFGNCFRTKKQAIKARDKIKSLLKEK